MLHAPHDGTPTGIRDGDPLILVVDDNPINVELVRSALTRFGVGRVASTLRSSEAAPLVRTLRPDVVLLDLHMPGLDGFGVLEAIRTQQDPGEFLPVMVLTADASLAAKRSALGTGADDFLTKPFDLQELVLRVRILLRTRALHTALRSHNAELAAAVRDRLENDTQQRTEASEVTSTIQRAVEGIGLDIVVQPVRDLGTGRLVGVEALARFPGAVPADPAPWFRRAQAVGMLVQLELAAVRSALRLIPSLDPAAFLAVNVSPSTMASDTFGEIMEGSPPGRVVVEVTERIGIDDYDAMNLVIDRLRRIGVRVAVDDAGAGFSSLQHVLRLRPEFVKLDSVFTHDIDRDPARRALAASLLSFTTEIGSLMIAEGVETEEERLTLATLGVPYAQGFHLGRPGPLAILAGVARSGPTAQLERVDTIVPVNTNARREPSEHCNNRSS